MLDKFVLNCNCVAFFNFSDNWNSPLVSAFVYTHLTHSYLVKRISALYCKGCLLLQIVDHLLVKCPILGDCCEHFLGQCWDEAGRYCLELVLGLGLCYLSDSTYSFWRRWICSIKFSFKDIWFLVVCELLQVFKWFYCDLFAHICAVESFNDQSNEFQWLAFSTNGLICCFFVAWVEWAFVLQMAYQNTKKFLN